MVGALYQDGPAAAQAFLDRLGDAGYPHLLDASGTLAVDFGVTGPPETFYVDADGIIRDKVIGPLTPATLDRWIASIPSAAAVDR